MPKKTNVRVAAVEGKLQQTVDEGASVSAELKKLGAQDKTHKKFIREQAEAMMEPGELNLRLAGTKALALVTVTQKYSVDVGAEGFPALERGVDAGLLGGVVERTVVATIAPAKLEQVQAALEQAGFGDALTVQRQYAVNPSGYRAFQEAKGSPESEELKKAMRDCVTRDDSARISFDLLKTEE